MRLPRRACFSERLRSHCFRQMVRLEVSIFHGVLRVYTCRSNIALFVSPPTDRDPIGTLTVRCHVAKAMTAVASYVYQSCCQFFFQLQKSPEFPFEGLLHKGDRHIFSCFLSEVFPHDFFYLLSVRRFVEVQDFDLDTGNELAHVNPHADNFDLPCPAGPTSMRTSPVLVYLTSLILTPSLIRTALGQDRLCKSFYFVVLGADVITTPPSSGVEVAAAAVRALAFFP